MFVLALENKYYVPTGVRIPEDWERIYGHIFYYLNQGGNTEEMWTDAKRQAARQVNDWPYKWLNEQDYHKRGSVEGQLKLSNKISPSGAWALLALPDEIIPESIEFGEWWRDVGPYHYVTKINEDGSFSIPNVRCGNYDLFIWHEGIYGEFKKSGLSVRDDENLDVGTCVLTSRDNGHLLWQLGVPNRTVTEFKNGGNFHQWDTYLRYRPDFPQGMNIKIGKSDPKKDWNYLQPAIIQGEKEPTSAGISFDFDPSIPGDPLLTVVAGGRSVSMEILINDKKIGDLKIARIGLQHIRTSPNGELTVHKYSFDRSLLQAGDNQLTLRFAGAGEATEETKQWNYPKWTSYIAYDFIRMEMVEKIEDEGKEKK